MRLIVYLFLSLIVSGCSYRNPGSSSTTVGEEIHLQDQIAVKLLAHVNEGTMWNKAELCVIALGFVSADDHQERIKPLIQPQAVVFEYNQEGELIRRLRAMEGVRRAVNFSVLEKINLILDSQCKELEGSISISTEKREFTLNGEQRAGFNNVIAPENAEEALQERSMISILEFNVGELFDELAPAESESQFIDLLLNFLGTVLWYRS